MAATEAPLSWLKIGEPTIEGYTSALRPYLTLATHAFLNRWRNSPDYSDSPALQEDIDIYAKLLDGGKKLRAGLVVLGYENSDGEAKFRSGVLTAAVGYELLHNAFLVHDDIEDNSMLRRGMPTAHEQYRTNLDPHLQADGRHYGVAVAINTGNIGATRALEAVWSINNHQDRIALAQRWLIRVMDTTLQGQRRDLTARQLADLTEDEVYTICRQKTAFYTISGPLNLGGILAGARQELLTAQEHFGEKLGVAFQLVDDHLGLYGDESVTGKPVGSDIAEAKKTLHFVESWARADQKQRELLIALWGKNNISSAEVAQIQALVAGLGVKTDVLTQARTLANEARNAVDEMTDKPLIKSILADLIDFVVYRSY